MFSICLENAVQLPASLKFLCETVSKRAILVTLTFLKSKQHQDKGIIAGSETVKIMYS